MFSHYKKNNHMMCSEDEEDLASPQLLIKLTVCERDGCIHLRPFH